MAHILGRFWILQLPGILRPPRCVVLYPMVLRTEVNLHRLAPAPSFPRMSIMAFSLHLAFMAYSLINRAPKSPISISLSLFSPTYVLQPVPPPPQVQTPVLT